MTNNSFDTFIISVWTIQQKSTNKYNDYKDYAVFDQDKNRIIVCK